MIRELKELRDSDLYPFHMPGHKRNMADAFLPEAYALDITEIDGFDDLQKPEGLIKEIEDRAAAYYGTDRAFLLVNGSSCGNLSAVSALVRHGGRLLTAGSCHRSVDNAILLNGLDRNHIKPENIGDTGIPGGITPGQVREALDKAEDTEAVLLTSPGYEGVISDVERIAETVHERRIPLIVDGAHGAHLPVCREADIITVSLHKTLPAFTSTSLCLVNEGLVDPERIKKYINIFQTTSPSYLLMAGAEQCFDIIERQGKALKARLLENLRRLYEASARNRYLKITGKEYTGQYGVFDFDETKICLMDLSGRRSGKEIYDTLRSVYRLQPEKADGRICLCMSSIMDTDEGFKRLIDAVGNMDRAWD